MTRSEAEKVARKIVERYLNDVCGGGTAVFGGHEERMIAHLGAAFGAMPRKPAKKRRH